MSQKSRIPSLFTFDALEARTLFSAGGIDATFGDSGIVRGNFDLPATTTIRSLTASDVALQPDGKSVVVGPSFAARFNRDGSLDATFAQDGIAEFSQRLDASPQVMLGMNGRLTVIARSDFDEGRVQMIRLLPTGELDQGFGTGGLQEISLAAENFADRFALDAADRVLLGVAPRYGGETASIMRLTSSGAIDRGFGQRGATLLDLLPGSEGIADIHVTRDGRILLGIYGTDLTLARLTARGRLDRSFDGNGVASIPSDQATRVSVVDVDETADGRYVLLGDRSIERAGVYGLSEGVAVGRLLSDGRIDATFGADGLINSTEWGLTKLSFSYRGDPALVQMPDGMLGISFIANQRQRQYVTQLKLRGNGSLNSNFGRDGVRLLDEVPGEFDAGPVQMRTDGSSVYLQTFGIDQYYTGDDFSLRSFGADGAVDPVFTAPDGGKIARPNSFGTPAVLSDGRMVLPANRPLGRVLLGVNPANRLDSSFGQSGVAPLSDWHPHWSSPATAMALPDGTFATWYVTTDPTDGDPIAAVVNKYTAQGARIPETLGPNGEEHYLSDETGGAIVNVVNGNWIGVTYEKFWADERTGFIVRPDGRILDVGISEIRGGENSRYDFYPVNRSIIGVLPGPNGTFYGFGQAPVYIGGESYSLSSYEVRDIIRRTQGDGSIPQFGESGEVYGISQVLASDSTGRILYRDATGMRRLQLNGSRDRTFGASGVAKMPVGYDNIAFDSQNRIIAWRTLVGGAADGDIQVMRLTANGKIDTTFGGGDGVVVIDTKLPSTAKQNLLVTPQNKIVVTSVQLSETRVRWSATRLLDE